MREDLKKEKESTTKSLSSRSWEHYKSLFVSDEEVTSEELSYVLTHMRHIYKTTLNSAIKLGQLLTR